MTESGLFVASCAQERMHLQYNFEWSAEAGVVFSKYATLAYLNPYYIILVSLLIPHLFILRKSIKIPLLTKYLPHPLFLEAVRLMNGSHYPVTFHLPVEISHHPVDVHNPLDNLLHNPNACIVLGLPASPCRDLRATQSPGCMPSRVAAKLGCSSSV